jgi:hypothetical protein
MLGVGAAMRSCTALVLLACCALVVTTDPAAASCPPTCFSGGGPGATDCFLQWSGLTSKSLTCADGDPACDLDGRLDGVCTLNVAACINMPDASGACAPSTLSAPPKASGRGIAAFRSALATLDPAQQACTTGGVTTVLAVKASGIKPVVMRVRTTAVSGGKRDTDSVKLTCVAGRPTLAAVQPIFTAKCATLGCHSDSTRSGGLTLTAGKARPAMLNVRATFPKWILLKAGNPKKSFLVRKLFPLSGLLGSPMPQGCRITNTCLTPEELATIIAWVQAGAPE